MVPFRFFVVVANESLSILAVEQRIFEPMLAARNRRAHGINRYLKGRAIVEAALFMKVRLAPRHPFPFGRQRLHYVIK